MPYIKAASNRYPMMRKVFYRGSSSVNFSKMFQTQAFLKQIRYSPYEIPAQAMLKNHCQMDVSVRNGQNVTHDNVGAHTNLNEVLTNFLCLEGNNSFFPWFCFYDDYV